MKNYKDMYISVVIVAAGKSSRMNSDINKQYIEIDGIPVIARTISVFENCDFVNEIIVVINYKDIIYFKENIVENYNFKKVISLVAGGTERQNSVLNGLNEVNNKCNIVLIHDGARPFIGQSSIINSVEAAKDFGAACVAVPVKDTIKKVNKDNNIDKTLERNTLWSIQTPQTFQYDLIMEAHKKALNDNFLGTDDSVLVENLGYKVKIVMGDYTNIKITTNEDLIFAEAIVENY